MARREKPKAVTAQMYRHFAVLTVAVTLVIGLFADGETRQAVASEVRAVPLSAPSARPTELVRKDRRAPGFAGDVGFDGNFGAPMDAVGATPQDGYFAAESTSGSGSGVPAGYTQYGVSAEVWAALTEEQKKALIARRNAEQAAAKAPDRPTQIDGLLAASRARSGEATIGD